jgi:hypothetical protein
VYWETTRKDKFLDLKKKIEKITLIYINFLTCKINIHSLSETLNGLIKKSIAYIKENICRLSASCQVSTLIRVQTHCIHMYQACTINIQTVTFMALIQVRWFHIVRTRMQRMLHFRFHILNGLPFIKATNITPTVFCRCMHSLYQTTVT